MKKMLNGHTNISYEENGFFVQEKIKNGLNHKSDYSQLSQFDFVPKLIHNDNNISKWELIDGSNLNNPNDDDLKQIAKNLKILHNSNVVFAKFNLRKRVEEYRKIMQQKQIKIEIVEKLYRKINLILKNMDHSTPVHGDLYQANILKDKNNNLFFIDWEYSHMGDRHYELAYWIEASRLNKEQEELFLNEYQDYDEYILRKHKVFVNYLTVLWLHAQDVMPFSDQECIQKLIQYFEEGF